MQISRSGGVGRNHLRLDQPLRAHQLPFEHDLGNTALAAVRLPLLIAQRVPAHELSHAIDFRGFYRARRMQANGFPDIAGPGRSEFRTACVRFISGKQCRLMAIFRPKGERHPALPWPAAGRDRFATADRDDQPLRLNIKPLKQSQGRFAWPTAPACARQPTPGFPSTAPTGGPVRSCRHSRRNRIHVPD